MIQNPTLSERNRQAAARAIDPEAFRLLQRQINDFSYGRKDDPWAVFRCCAYRGIVNYPPPTAMERVMAAYDMADCIRAAVETERVSMAAIEQAAIAEILPVLREVADFVSDESDNRHEAGSYMSDYRNEAEEALEKLRGVIDRLTGVGRNQ